MYFNPYAAGYRIQKLRKAHGLTQEEAAIKLNISDRHMRSLEKALMHRWTCLLRLQYILMSLWITSFLGKLKQKLSWHSVKKSMTRSRL